jgi:hypothetical protein
MIFIIKTVDANKRSFINKMLKTDPEQSEGLALLCRLKQQIKSLTAYLGLHRLLQFSNAIVCEDWKPAFIGQCWEMLHYK